MKKFIIVASLLSFSAAFAGKTYLLHFDNPFDQDIHVHLDKNTCTYHSDRFNFILKANEKDKVVVWETKNSGSCHFVIHDLPMLQLQFFSNEGVSFNKNKGAVILSSSRLEHYLYVESCTKPASVKIGKHGHNAYISWKY